MLLRSLAAPRIITLLLAACLCLTVQASNVGRHLPPEKRTITDKVTGQTLTFLTTDPASDSKPYQTHTTWTADGKWIIFRSDRGGGPQAYLVNEQTGDIVQITDGPASGTGSLNLSRKANKLYLVRGGPVWNPEKQELEPAQTPRQLVEINLDPLIADAMAGTPKDATAYQRVICELPADLRDAGGLALDADETKIYWGVSWGPQPPRPPRNPPTAASANDVAPVEPAGRRQIDDQNTDPNQSREAARKRFAEQGKGPGGIRSIDLQSGEIKTVIDVDFRMGHVQTNPWVPGEIIYCHETTGDGPQRMWTVRADGTGNRPLYAEYPDEWITHETVATKDEVMFNIMGHLPYLREHPTGIAVINLRTNQMKLLGQVEEKMTRGTGGFWHCNGSPDGNWAVGDTFLGNVYLIDRNNGERILLTTDHKMRPDHTHPIFKPDGKRIAIQSGQLTDGKALDIVVLDVPEALLKRYAK
ncbi:MAG: hypothetical protein QM790_16675 [Nibricoccus sp.]